MNSRIAILLGCLLLVATGCKSNHQSPGAPARERVERLRGTFGTYNSSPRRQDGRVDVDRLVAELTALKARTYNFLIWHAATDWDDLKLFLPLARAKGITVWVTLVPPSESPPRSRTFSEPFRLDYKRWAVEIARLSRREPNLVAWSLDDFSYDSATFTPEYMTRMIADMHAINPRLAFVPCLYYSHITPELAAKYRPFLDGVLFPYRHEAGKRNLQEWDTLEAELSQIRERFGREMPVFVDVYATKHSKLSDSSPEYVDQVMNIAHRAADGVLIYCHPVQKSNPEKYKVIKRNFHDWSAELQRR